MSPSESLRIFISYSRKDGAALAQRLQDDLTKEGFDAWLDMQRIRSAQKIASGLKVTLPLMAAGGRADHRVTVYSFPENGHLFLFL
jgi:hypothetical protein